jgi:hypothetical protein
MCIFSAGVDWAASGHGALAPAPNTTRLPQQSEQGGGRAAQQLTVDPGSSTAQQQLQVPGYWDELQRDSTSDDALQLHNLQPLHGQDAHDEGLPQAISSSAMWSR